MALRKRAVNNAATSTMDSPGPALSLPQTPRNRPSIFVDRSPASTSSISSNFPFDWEAARSRPYGTPQSAAKSRRSAGVPGTPLRKAIVRKQGQPRTSAWIIGGTMHFIHFCLRVNQMRKISDADLGWEDLYQEDSGQSWFDWTVPLTLLLVTAAVLNTVYLFSRIKLYRLHLRPDPVSSPNAKFVPANLDFQPLEPPPLTSRMIKSFMHGFSVSWRFLLGFQPPVSPPAPSVKTRVQQLEVWTPGELEMTLFNVYSPVHAFLWMATGSSNWILMILIMGLVGVQANAMTLSYKALLKDKEIIAAEVFNEYNSGFVYPRINPVRKDVAVMTHQSEVVNIWED
ncbi:hypothetical protein FB45DRAFT_912982 [Roridomyces roridus]|uniref:Nuclear rim protein 1 n=1 Tax=Roridomyces roridus TaxID=1738132 RepID=A0AAD7FMD5_9AGAR|nr:hypothetical protein FB45DRAFT_912982 [Roridomyces roridus]